jgi:hypothetical protein
MAGKRLVSNERKLLDAISTLKRVTGTPDSNIEPDHKYEKCGGYFCVRTTDHDSALLMANLISQCVMGLYGHTERYWSKTDPVTGHKIHGGGLHEDVVIVDDGNNQYRVNISVMLNGIGELADAINKKAQDLIAPNGRGCGRG